MAWQAREVGVVLDNVRPTGNLLAQLANLTRYRAVLTALARRGAMRGAPACLGRVSRARRLGWRGLEG